MTNMKMLMCDLDGTLLVNEKDKLRLDSYIAKKDNSLSRSMIQKMLDEGKITVNGKIEKASYKTKVNDRIQVEEIIATSDYQEKIEQIESRTTQSEIKELASKILEEL